MAPKAKRSVQDILIEREALAGAERDCKKRLRAALAGECVDAKPAAAPRPFTAYERDIALTLYMMDNCSVEAAVDFLSRSPAGCTRNLVAGFVESWAAEEPQDALLSLAFVDEAPKKTVFMRASKFYAKWRLEGWIANQNDQKGIAPPTASVLAQHDVLLAERLGEGLLLPRGDMTVSRNRQWATRLRRAFFCKLGTPKLEEDLSAAEIQAKVLSLLSGKGGWLPIHICMSSPHFLSPQYKLIICFSGPVFGAIFGPRNWAALSNSFMSGHISVPLCGPERGSAHTKILPSDL